MFLGEYQHQIDDKGRLALPAKFRPLIGKRAIVTRGLDSCLFVFPQAEWRKLAERLSQLPLAQANSRAFARLMLAGAMDVEPDSQGRITVPEYLRKFANLKTRSVIAGVYNRMEIWSEERWRQYKTQSERQSDTIAEQVAALGI